MELPASTHKVASFGNFKDNEVTIDDTSLILEYLRESIYSNPIRTIVQELMSNARDAHRELGKFDIPIKVKLPDDYDCNFQVIDEGPGISPQRMQEVYLKIGASTKRGSNVQTGAFGIGSKSPWAYTEAFTITTKWFEDNKLFKKSYSAVIAENRACKLVEFGSAVEIDPSEGSGTTVTVPVKLGHFHKFIQHAKEVTLHWTKKPIFLNDAQASEYKLPNYIIETDFYKVQEKATRSFCLVDEIPYPLNIYECDVSNLGEGIVFIFPVGALSLAISRESLRYNDKTKAAIKDAANRTRQDLQVKLSEKLKNAKTLKEAIILYKEFSNQFSFIKLSGEWQGKKLESYINIYENHTPTCICWKMDRHGTRKKPLLIYVDKTSQIIYNDDVNNIQARVAKYLKDNPDINAVYVIKSRRDTGNKKTDEYEKTFKKWYEEEYLGELSIKASSLPVLEDPATPKVKRISSQRYFMTGKGDRQLIDRKTYDGYYLLLDDSRPLYTKEKEKIYNIAITLNSDFIIIRPKDLDKLPKAKNVKELLEKRLTEKKVITNIKKASIQNTFSCQFIQNFQSLLYPQIKNEKYLINLITELYTKTQGYTSVYEFKKCMEYLRYKPSMSYNDDIDKLNEIFQENYFLCNYISYYDAKDHTDKILKYIEFIEKEINFDYDTYSHILGEL